MNAKKMHELTENLIEAAEEVGLAYPFGVNDVLLAKNALAKTVEELRSEFAAQDAEIARLREALEWYADINNYADDHAPIIASRDFQWFDDGYKARKALSEDGRKVSHGATNIQ
jgi:hypothetical protein